MNRPMRLSGEEALRRLQLVQAVDSGDEFDTDDDDVGLSESIAECNSDGSDSGTDDVEVTTSDGISGPSATQPLVAPDGSGQSSTLASKDGTKWTVLSISEQIGRFQSQNVFTAKSGITAYCRSVAAPVDAFRLILDDGCLRHIAKCTVDYARTKEKDWNMSIRELNAFIGLLYLRGAMNARNFPLDDLWSEKYGCPAFGKAMARNRFREIKKYIRFDCKSNRQSRIGDDKFCMISYVLNRFAENSQKCYVPEDSLTIDEQLFPTKSRCRFIQYMPNKPDKFGIKFWILAEVKSKYCLNIRPYLGKDEERVDSLGTHVVMNLMEPY